MKRLKFLTASVATLAVLATANLVSAQQPANVVSVEPASLYFDMSGPVDKKVSMLTIRNDYNVPINLSAEFKGIDESAGKIIPTGEPSPAIVDTLKLSQTQFRVPSHGKYFLTVQATDDGKLAPGGHYATLVLTDVSSGSKTASVLSQVSVGVFLVKRDGLVQRVALTQHAFERSIFTLPTSVDVEVLNDGNSHLTPRASVRLLDGKQNVISEEIFNRDSSLLLPEKRLLQTLSLKPTKNFYVPQKFTLQIAYRADEIDQAKVYNQTFWYIPVFYVYLAILGLAILAFVGVKNRSKINAKTKQWKTRKK